MNRDIISFLEESSFRYVFLENISPDDVTFDDSRPVSLEELFGMLSSRKRLQRKRKIDDSNIMTQPCPGKSVKVELDNDNRNGDFIFEFDDDDFDEAVMVEFADDNPAGLGVIEKQAKVIIELENKLKHQTELCEKYTCSICFQVVIKPTTLVPCQHVYCHKCISEFRASIHSQRGNMSCPMCRSAPLYFFPNKNLQDTIDLMLQSYLTDEEMLERKKIEQEYLESEKDILEIFKTITLTTQ